MKELSKRDDVRVILKAMDLLVSLAECPLTVLQLSERAGVSIPAVYRILKTLDSGGFVIRDPQNREYTLGPALIGLGRAARSSVELIRHVRPALRELHEKYNETVNLGVLSHGKIIYLDTLESQQRLRVTVPMMVVDNFHTTALGKAILAAIPDDLLLETIQESTLTKRTVNTLVSQQQLLETIKKSRTLGYAIDNEEDEIGFRCVAAPILNSSNFPIAAISVTAPISRTSMKDFALIGRYLVSVCASLKKTIPPSFS
jgi:DNA-binding IclR family transcriptional regulator